MANEEWLTIEETARYLQLGKTALYDLAREGTVPSSKVGSKWLFNKRDLDAWVRSNIPLEQFFLKTAAHIEENLKLREPQVEAYKALYEYFKSGGKTAVIQIPVGCQCRDKTPAILPVLPTRGGGNLGGDAVGTLQ